MFLFGNASLKRTIKTIVNGVAVGDALGVPWEFSSRALLKKEPVTDIVGYRQYKQAPGTWSDDTVGMLCVMDALFMKNNKDCNDVLFLHRFMDNFFFWTQGSFYGLCNTFDIGGTTLRSLERFQNTRDITTCGEHGERANGNGCLIRAFPLAFYLKNASFEKRCHFVHLFTYVTHAHPISFIATLFLTTYCVEFLNGKAAVPAFLSTQKILEDYISKNPELTQFTSLFSRLFSPTFCQTSVDEIRSTPYVIDTLEAAFWSLFLSSNFKSTVLTSVNLGGDTDSIAAISGGLAALIYGKNGFPKDWLKLLYKPKVLNDVAAQFANAL